MSPSLLFNRLSTRLTGLIAALLAFIAAPSVASACGSIFCNANQPINQAAERILFARDGDTMHMHVQLTYQGPPAEFAWLLPAPPDVDTALSSEQLFAALDASFGPIFQMRFEFHSHCFDPFVGGGGGIPGAFSGSFTADSADSRPSTSRFEPAPIAVLSREAVGPYDRVILAATEVDALRDWLDENGFAVPTAVDATLGPYLEMGSVFVAIKLLPGAGDGDILPLRLSFTSDMAAVPIVPTQLAANPDMGLIVHVLDDARAIPVNYDHVRINDAAIDWTRAGQNYADVVSAAVDEAKNGLGFVTDYAGPAAGVADTLPTYDAEFLRQIEATDTLMDPIYAVAGLDADIQRVLSEYMTLPTGVPANAFWQCPGCWSMPEALHLSEGAAAAISKRIETEVNPPRRAIRQLFAQNSYITRLYTTLSPEEMVLDPIFATNPDLGDVARQYTATEYIICSIFGEELPDLSYLETPSGTRLRLDDNRNVPGAIERRGGQTRRGTTTPAAMVVEKLFEQGPPETITDNRTRIAEYYRETPGGCSVHGMGHRSRPPLWTLGLLATIGLRRRQ